MTLFILFLFAGSAFVMWYASSSTEVLPGEEHQKVEETQ